MIEELQDDIADGIANLTNYNNGNKSLRILKCYNFFTIDRGNLFDLNQVFTYKGWGRRTFVYSRYFFVAGHVDMS